MKKSLNFPLKKSLKRAAACLFAFVLGAGAAGCGDGETGVKLPPEGELMTYTEYDLDTYLKPLWYTREIYNETVLFVGAEDSAPLMYTAREIVSVRNFGLDIEYEQGRDWVYESGKLRRVAGGEIPYFEIDDYYRTRPDTVSIAVDKSKIGVSLTGDRYLKYGEGNTFTQKQIAVTYRTDEAWTGPVPADKGNKIAKSLAKLRAKEQTKILFYGDSISTGCNASGTSLGGNVSPYCDSWMNMIQKYFEKKFDSDVQSVNTAQGGWTAEQGQDAFQARVIEHSPDLLFLAFGANNMTTGVGEYKLMIQDMIERYHAALPDSEIVLVAGYGPNYESTWLGNQNNFREALLALEKEYSFVAAADVTEMVLAAYDRGVRFRDMTGNNINHPNDFAIRLYAQTILKTMLGSGFGGEQ